MKFTYLKQPLNKYTFKSPKIKEWVESRCKGNVLNLFAGKIKLKVKEIRNDIDKTMIAHSYKDAYNFVKEWIGIKFDTILLDPPYAYRKAMELYNGNYTSKFNLIKEELPRILNANGIIIVFGYHSVFMGKKRGFETKEICLINHGGAQHDTIAIVEGRINE
jgi:hypothetical protein